jgi:hypothetical protein
MTPCLDDDTLVSLATAVNWDGDMLQHLLQCANCQEQLKQIGDIREIASVTREPRPGFVDEVMNHLTSDLPEDTSTETVSRWLQVLNPLLAAVTALGVVQMAAAESSLQMGPQVLIIPVVVAATTLWWNRKHGEKVQVA